METIILIIHLMIAIALVISVLLQKSEGGALGIGGGGGGFMTGRGAADALTSITTMLAAAFFVTSITLTILSGSARTPTSITEDAPVGKDGKTKPTGLGALLPPSSSKPEKSAPMTPPK